MKLSHAEVDRMDQLAARRDLTDEERQELAELRTRAVEGVSSPQRPPVKSRHGIELPFKDHTK